MYKLRSVEEMGNEITTLNDIDAIERDFAEFDKKQKIKNALHSLAGYGICSMTPQITGYLMEIGYFDARMNGMTSKEFYAKWLEEQYNKRGA